MQQQWEEERNRTGIVVAEEEIADVVAIWTKIPVHKDCTGRNRKPIMKLEETLHHQCCRTGRSSEHQLQRQYEEAE